MREGLGLADAWLLWVLVPLYAAWILAWWRRVGRDGGRAALRYSSVALLRPLPASRRLAWRRAAQGLRLLTVALLMLAMARPQSGRKLVEVTTEGVDIVLVMDTSGSMRALDLDADRPLGERRDRLAVAKDVVGEFVAGRASDQLGLVVFGEEAFTQCPLTLDHDILLRLLERLEVGVAGDATALGSALGVAAKRLRESPARSKVIVLLTDGRNNAGALSPGQAAEIARALDIKVHAVGVGTRGDAPFLVDTPFGKQVVYQDVDVDDEGLEEITALTGGEYFRAEDRQGLARVYERIDALETTEISARFHMEYEERFRWLLLPAVGMLLAEVALLGTRLRRVP